MSWIRIYRPLPPSPHESNVNTNFSLRTSYWRGGGGTRGGIGDSFQESYTNPLSLLTWGSPLSSFSVLSFDFYALWKSLDRDSTTTEYVCNQSVYSTRYYFLTLITMKQRYMFQGVLHLRHNY